MYNLYFFYPINDLRAWGLILVIIGFLITGIQSVSFFWSSSHSIDKRFDVVSYNFGELISNSSSSLSTGTATLFFKISSITSVVTIDVLEKIPFPSDLDSVK